MQGDSMCNHNGKLRYCEKCKKVFCEECGEEFIPYKGYIPYPYPYFIPYPYPYPNLFYGWNTDKSSSATQELIMLSLMRGMMQTKRKGLSL